MKKKLFLLVILLFIVFCILVLMNNQKLQRSENIVEPIYTQDCFPRTLQMSGVTKKCFENANFGKTIYCSESEIIKIKQYYKQGQDKDPLNDGTGKFCAD